MKGKKGILKRIFGIVICFIMLLNFVPVISYADEGFQEAYDIWVGNTQITTENQSDVLGDGTVSYDEENNLLTLNGADVTEGYQNRSDGVAGILAKGDLDIELIGENKISVPGGKAMVVGMHIEGDMNISGTGTLIVNVGEAVAENKGAESVGMYINGNLEINEAIVIINAGNATVTDSGIAFSNGIYMYGDIALDLYGALMIMTGTAKGEEAYSSGIESSGDEDNYRNIAVYDGYLEVVVGDAFGTVYAGSMGIGASYGGFYVYDSKALVVLKSGYAEASDGFANSVGLYSFAGDVNINGGNVSISSGSWSGQQGVGYGVYLIAVEEDEVISGGYLDISCEQVSLRPYSPGLTGTTVDISAEKGTAICADMGVETDDTLTISNPNKGEIKIISEEDGFEYWTVTDVDGNAAESVSIKPLGYEVSIKGLSYDRAVQVAAGKSINEMYCEFLDIEDFSEVINTQKEGYTFGGWYTDEACTDGNEYNFDLVVTDNVTIYPKWIANIDENPENTPDEDIAIPVTSDSGYSVLWIMVLAISMSVAIGMMSCKKKREIS